MIDLRLSHTLFFFVLFFILSTNIILSSIYFDLTLISCLLIYIFRWDESSWIISIILFFIGIFNDLIISTPIGYSSSLFLFFYLINRAGVIFGISLVRNIKFIIFLLIVSIIFTVNYFTIYFTYNISIPIYVNLIPHLVIILLYYPIDTIILFIQKRYVREK